MNSTGSGTAPRAAGDGGGQADISRGLHEAAREALRDRGRIVIGDTEYLVIIPGGARPGDPVYLRRRDGRVLAVDLHATARDAGPGEIEL